MCVYLFRFRDFCLLYMLPNKTLRTHFGVDFNPAFEVTSNFGQENGGTPPHTHSRPGPLLSIAASLNLGA